GIRDFHVTGVQTCALPIYHAEDARVSDDALWYKDSIIYQVHIKSFRDSNRDGYGDFPGLLEKLDYIQSLGVDCIWLLPFYPSPQIGRASCRERGEMSEGAR